MYAESSFLWPTSAKSTASVHDVSYTWYTSLNLRRSYCWQSTSQATPRTMISRLYLLSQHYNIASIKQRRTKRYTHLKDYHVSHLPSWKPSPRTVWGIFPGTNQESAVDIVPRLSYRCIQLTRAHGAILLFFSLLLYYIRPPMSIILS